MTEKEFRAEIANIAGEDPNTVALDSALSSFGGWDSLAVVQFIALADEQFHTVVAPDDIKACRTVGDLFALARGEKITA